MIFKKFIEKITPIHHHSSNHHNQRSNSATNASLVSNGTNGTTTTPSTTTSTATTTNASAHKKSTSDTPLSSSVDQLNFNQNLNRNQNQNRPRYSSPNVDSMKRKESTKINLDLNLPIDIKEKTLNQLNSDSNLNSSYYCTNDYDYQKESYNSLYKLQAKPENIENLHFHHDHITSHILKNAHHSDRLVQKLSELRKNNQMCDITLMVNGNEIKCHKHILAVNSPYFLAMFTNGLLETNQSSIELKEIDFESLKLLVDYMYTGELTITETNVQYLLATSNIFGLTNIKDACGQFIQSQLDTSNCLGIREFADYHSCPILQKHADAYIEEYFSEIIGKEEFLGLNVDQLASIISSNHLAVKSERVIFDAVIRWISHDAANRKEYVERLIECVRMPLMENKDLAEIVEEPLIKDNSFCKGLILKAFQEKASNSIKDSSNSCFNTKARTPLGLPRIMYIFGGQALGFRAIDTVESYDFRLQQWTKLKQMPTKRCRAGCIYHEGLIYIIGGFNGEFRTRSVDIYNLVKEEWTSGTEMLCRRATLGVGLLNEKIYAVGGFDGVSGLNSVERYDPSSKLWTFTSSMDKKRSSVAVAVLKNYLYAIGGFCGESRECLHSAERYNPLIDKWETVASMNMRRSGASVNVYNEKIYVAGGHDGPVIHNSVEFYDPLTDKWTFIAEMNTCRRNAGFIINNGLFYILGGDDGKTNLSSVEIYNLQRNVWSLSPSFLNEAKSYLGCVITESFR